MTNVSNQLDFLKVSGIYNIRMRHGSLLCGWQSLLTLDYGNVTHILFACRQTKVSSAIISPWYSNIVPGVMCTVQCESVLIFVTTEIVSKRRSSLTVKDCQAAIHSSEENSRECQSIRGKGKKTSFLVISFPTRNRDSSWLYCSRNVGSLLTWQKQILDHLKCVSKEWKTNVKWHT